MNLKVYNLLIIFNMFIKYFILFILSVSSLLSMFINDLINIWLLMEINNFLFISYLSMMMKNKKMIFFYFIVQIIPSLILIFSISMNNFNSFDKNILLMTIYLSLMIKLGIPPFHFWMPLISLYMNMNMLFFLFTIQKIIPFYILSIISIKNYFLMMSLILCSLIPPIMMLNLTNLKKLLSYSSINQLSWMILLIYLKNVMWIFYLFMYSMITMLILFLLNLNKTYNNFLNNNNMNYNMILLLIMLNMSGMPPFSFFMFKWFSIYLLIYNSNLFMISIIMIISSFMMFYLYLNMIYLSMFINLLKSKLIYKNYFTFKFNHMFIFFMIFFSPMLILMN